MKALPVIYYRRLSSLPVIVQHLLEMKVVKELFQWLDPPLQLHDIKWLQSGRDTSIIIYDL